MSDVSELFSACRLTRRLPAHAWLFLVPLGLFLLGALQGFRIEYLVCALLFAVLPLAGPRGRGLARVALPLVLVGLIYDHLEPLLALRAPIHVADLYYAELFLFGVPTGGERVLPSEWLSSYANAPLDLATGLAYVVYLYQFFLVVGVLYLRRYEALARRLAYGFLVVNAIGMAVWLLYPAAPPWYVERYGLGPAEEDAIASAAGASRFDTLVGIPYFAEFYERSRNVFGAMPSLHVSYPALVFLAVRRFGRWAAALSLGFAVLVAFAAVYLEHHYVLDVIAGALAAVIAALAVGIVPARTAGKGEASS